MLDALEQGARQRTQARPNLDYVVVGPRIERGDDALDVMPIDQEVLAETLARDVPNAASSLSGRAQWNRGVSLARAPPGSRASRLRPAARYASVQSRMTLPLWPESRVANASSYCSAA